MVPSGKGTLGEGPSLNELHPERVWSPQPYTRSMSQSDTEKKQIGKAHGQLAQSPLLSELTAYNLTAQSP